MPEFLDNLLTQNLKRLEKYVFRRVDNPLEAEEIVQETLISCVDAYPTFNNKSSFFTWLCGIANHELSDFYRKKKIKTVLFSVFPWLEELADSALGPEQLVLKKEIESEIEKRVKTSLSRLNEGYSEILRLKYYQGLSVKEISEKLNETAKTVESRLTRARKAFSKVYLTDLS